MVRSAHGRMLGWWGEVSDSKSNLTAAFFRVFSFDFWNRGPGWDMSNHNATQRSKLAVSVSSGGWSPSRRDCLPRLERIVIINFLRHPFFSLWFDTWALVLPAPVEVLQLQRVVLSSSLYPGLYYVAHITRSTWSEQADDGRQVGIAWWSRC